MLQVISKAKTTFTLVIAGTADIDVSDINDSTCLLIAVPDINNAPFSKAVRATSARPGDFATAGGCLAFLRVLPAG